MPSEDPSDAAPAEQSLRDERVAFCGRLAGMTVREATRLVKSRGGSTVDSAADATLIVVGDGQPGDTAEGDAPGAECVSEAQFWQQLGLTGEGVEVSRLYTPAMLAELLGVPVSVVRHWYRRGSLIAQRLVHRLPYFDFQEVTVARQLASLFHAGCSLRVIDRKVAELERTFPDHERPLADPAIFVEGKSVLLRREQGFTEPSGQRLLWTDPDDEATTDATLRFAPEEALPAAARSGWPPDEWEVVDELEALAIQCEQAGELAAAAEHYRSMLLAGPPAAETHLALADVLYRSGELPAARERYYAAIEIDEDCVEARASLGCVLAEMGQSELAVASLEGALDCHPDYADAHLHLAELLDQLGRAEQAERHWREFLRLAPESAWEDVARQRLGITV